MLGETQMKIKRIEKLYHGTNKHFDRFDFKYAKQFKDFGKGFYLTSNLNQAQRWAQKKSERSGKAYIYCYDVEKNLEDIKILELLQYNKEWVDFICKSRIFGVEAKYDIIYDKMADSQYTDIADTLQSYIENDLSCEDVINRIRWYNLDVDQYCFKSEKALQLLRNKQEIIQYKDESGIWKISEVRENE